MKADKTSETYWTALSNNFIPVMCTTRREAQEDAKSVRIAGDKARVCKVRLIEVK